jgi:hypothetical protein
VKRNRDEHTAEERCDALGDLAERTTPERGPDLAQWRAIASALHRRRPRLLFLLPAAATLAAALAITSQLSLRYRLDNCKAAEGKGKLVVGQSGEGTVELEDGSRFVLARGTQAEIQTRGFRRGAQLRLHQGHTSVSIVHRFAGRWDVVAGDFNVHVTGTRFEVDWQPNRSRFDVLVREGEVRVSGGWLKEELHLRAGQLLDADGETSTVTVGPIPPAAAASDKPPVQETLQRPPKAPLAAGPARPPRIARLSIARQGAQPRAPAPSEQPRLGKPSLIWTGDSFGPSRVGGDDDASVGGAAPAGSDGVIFTTIGKRTRFLPPASESPSHLYRQDAMLCTNVRVPALFCSGNSNSLGLESCDSEANWGVVLAWNPQPNQRAWGDATAGRISFEYQGAAGLYRLVAHREGDPDTRLYCVDAYASGQVVSPSDFRMDCWTKGGAVLPDFSSVDTFALHRPSTNSRQTLKLCISSVSLY